MHGAVREFVRRLSVKYPEHFRDQDVLEFGARNINGDVRHHFTDCRFTGIDAFPGDNVDVVCLAHTYEAPPDRSYGVVFSCEMLEHDPYWMQTIARMEALTSPGGLLFLTCATTGRGEHGTTRTYNPAEGLYTPDPDYYRNITQGDLTENLSLWIYESHFFERYDQKPQGIFFSGIKGVK